MVVLVFFSGCVVVVVVVLVLVSGVMSAHVAHLLADVGPMLAQACPYLSLMLTRVALLSAHVAHILADVGPMLAPRPSRRPVVRSGPRPKTQNHEKPMVF